MDTVIDRALRAPVEVKAGVALCLKQRARRDFAVTALALTAFFLLLASVTSRHTRYSVHEVLEHNFQDGSDSGGESTEDQTESEHGTFLFNYVANDKTGSLSSENTGPAPASGPALALASGAGTVPLADIGIFGENTIINDESGFSNKDDGDLWNWQQLTIHGVYNTPRSCSCDWVCE